jgi:hypothetical protein
MKDLGSKGLEFYKKNYNYFNKTSEAIGDYYKQFDKIEVTNETYEWWLESLEISGRDEPKDLGLELASKNLNFIRFALELNDHGLMDFLQDNLPKYIFKRWKNTEYIAELDVV